MNVLSSFIPQNISHTFYKKKRRFNIGFDPHMERDLSAMSRFSCSWRGSDDSLLGVSQWWKAHRGHRWRRFGRWIITITRVRSCWEGKPSTNGLISAILMFVNYMSFSLFWFSQIDMNERLIRRCLNRPAWGVSASFYCCCWVAFLEMYPSVVFAIQQFRTGSMSCKVATSPVDSRR